MCVQTQACTAWHTNTANFPGCAWWETPFKAQNKPSMTRTMMPYWASVLPLSCLLSVVAICRIFVFHLFRIYFSTYFYFYVFL